MCEVVCDRKRVLACVADSKKNYTKMKNLLDILTDPNKR